MTDDALFPLIEIGVRLKMSKDPVWVLYLRQKQSSEFNCSIVVLSPPSATFKLRLFFIFSSEVNSFLWKAVWFVLLALTLVQSGQLFCCASSDAVPHSLHPTRTWNGTLALDYRTIMLRFVTPRQRRIISKLRVTTNILKEGN